MATHFSRFLLVPLLTVVLLLPARFCQAQDEDSTYTTGDTSSVYEENDDDILSADNETDAESDVILPVIRTLSSDSVLALRHNPDFAYMTYLDSLLRARQKKKDHMPEEQQVYEGPSMWDSGIVKLICWSVAIGLVGFVLYRLFMGGGVFYSSKKQELPAVQLDETPDESDLEKAIQLAMQKEDYRMATRYLFLITLNRLGEKGVLQLSTEKTNYQYATELANKRYANSFARLSLQYEYVWFGGFDINQAQFAVLQQQHQQFLKEI